MMKSIRSQLLILIVAAVLPALGIIIYSNYERQQHDMQTASANALVMVQGLGNDHENDMEATRRFLMTLARLPVLQRRDAAACNKLFGELLRDNPQFSTIYAADRDGRLFANALPFGSISIQHRNYFQEALRTKTFSAGKYSIGEITGRAVQPFAYPVMDSGGRVVGVVAVGLDLERYGRSFTKITQFPKGSTLNLLDRNYTRLYRYPDNEKFAGKTELPEIIKKLSKGPREGVFSAVGVDGVRRLFAYKLFFLKDHSSPYLCMRIGIPEKQALAPARKSFLRSMTLVGISLIAAVLTAWLLGHYLIARKLDRLVDASLKVGQGDFSTRTGIEHTEGELGQLARSFDEMAQSLENKELERRQVVEALNIERNRLAGTIEGTRVGTWEWNVQTGETVFNERWAEIIGYTLAEISPVSIGTWMKYAHPDDLKQSNEKLEKYFRGELDYYECESRMRHKNGYWVWVLDRGRIASWTDDGKPHVMMGTHQDITERKRAEEEREKLIAELQEALSDVKVLSGMLPICASCKKIRDDKGYWNRLEAYIGKHTNAQFSHGICPECAKKLYPELYEKS